MTTPLFSGATQVSPAQFFPVSTTYVVPISGIYRVSAVGGGGSGGAADQPRTADLYGAASGGGGGGFTETQVYLSAGFNVVIVIGEGGASASVTSGGTSANGNNGTNTTVVCSAAGLNLTANGGYGGYGTTNPGTQVGGGPGGASSGGINNQSGGYGGTAKTITNSGHWAQASGGGGACGCPFGPGGTAGEASSTASYAASTGGAGLNNGNSGNATASSATTWTYGAGIGQIGTNLTNTTPTPAYSPANVFGEVLGNFADGLVRGQSNGANYIFESLFDPWRSFTNISGNPAQGNNLDCYFCGYGGSAGIDAQASAMTRNSISIPVSLFGGAGSGGSVGNSSGGSLAGGNGLVTIERIG